MKIIPCAITFPSIITARKQDRSRFAILWWLYDKRTDTSGGTWEQTYRYLFFSSYTTEIDAKGDWREKNRIWPLYFSTSRTGFSHFHAPELIFMQSPGFDRLFGPWVYLWTQDRQDTYRQGKAFWGMYRWQEDTGLPSVGAEFSGRPGNHGQYQQVSPAFRPRDLGAGRLVPSAETVLPAPRL